MEESLPHSNSVGVRLFGSFSHCPFLWFKDNNRTNVQYIHFSCYSLNLEFLPSNPLLSITLGRVEIQERDGVWCLEAEVYVLIV